MGLQRRMMPLEAFKENNFTGYSACFSPRGQDCYLFWNCITENQTRSCIDWKQEGESVIPSPTFALLEKSAHISEVMYIPALPEKRVIVFDIKEESILIHKRESGNLSDIGSSSSSECLCLPYEWPMVASTYFPPVNSHLPQLLPLTGCIWMFYLRCLLQARNSQIEGGW